MRGSTRSRCSPPRTSRYRSESNRSATNHRGNEREELRSAGGSNSSDRSLRGDTMYRSLIRRECVDGPERKAHAEERHAQHRNGQPPRARPSSVHPNDAIRRSPTPNQGDDDDRDCGDIGQRNRPGIEPHVPADTHLTRVTTARWGGHRSPTARGSALRSSTQILESLAPVGRPWPSLDATGATPTAKPERGPVHRRDPRRRRLRRGAAHDTRARDAASAAERNDTKRCRCRHRDARSRAGGAACGKRSHTSGTRRPARDNATRRLSVYGGSAPRLDRVQRTSHRILGNHGLVTESAGYLGKAHVHAQLEISNVGPPPTGTTGSAAERVTTTSSVERQDIA
jgi:hypothetical protein